MSITPLGERSRGQRYGITLASFIGGALLGGAALGLVGGAVGALAAGPLAIDDDARLWLLLALIVVALFVDRVLGKIPGPTRQVNERWLGAYRGWVYGGGFGAQLGVGVATIVTTSTIYLVGAACVAAGTVAGGVLIGAAFGLFRALTVLPSARVRDTPSLLKLGDMLERRRHAVFRAMLALDVIALSIGVGLALA